MKKLAGLTVFMLLLYAALLISGEGARSAEFHVNLAKRFGLYGVISLGVGVLIVAGGIDLSIGAVVGLTATLTAVLLVDHGWSPWAALPTVLAVGAGIGTINGLLITKIRLQPFVVTLCGLFFYRGLARVTASDLTKGLRNQYRELQHLLATSRDVFGMPSALLILLAIAALVAVFLHLSVYGRYLFAIGSNERAAEYSGIAVNRYKVLAYALCSTLAACCGILYLMEFNSVQPSDSGSFFELYAIAGAVLGGCSLRGGEGSVPGIGVGIASLVMLPSLTTMWGVKSQYDPVVIGLALLAGAILDEWNRRRSARRGAG